MLAVAIVYVLLIGRRLLPREVVQTITTHPGRSIMELWKDFDLGESIDRLSINPESPLVGITIAESRLESRYRVRIHGILRRVSGGEERIAAPAPGTELHARDVLLVVGRLEDTERLLVEQALRRQPVDLRDRQRWLWELGGVAVLVHPESTLIGKSLREVEFRSNYDLDVMGLRRGKQVIADFKDKALHASDSLFVVGPWSRIQQLQSQTHDFVVLEVPSEHAETVPSYRRMPVALTILVAMVLLTVLDLVPLATAVMMAALAAVFTRCLSMEDAYRAIHWSSLVLIAGMLPLADALDKTGGTRLIVDTLMSAMGDASPHAMLGLIFFLTAVLGLVLSNTASAVLVAPIAIYTAAVLDVSPYPFAVAVLIAASAAYSTPVSTPVVTLVVDPGRYRFMDFIKVGVPLLLLTYAVTALLAPLIFPFLPA